MEELKLIAKGAGFIFAGFFVSKILALFYRVILTRFLEPAGIGIFSMGLAVLGIMTVFAGLGLYQGVLHFIAVYDGRNKKEKVKGTILGGIKMQIAGSCLFCVAMFLLAEPIALYFFKQPELVLVLQVLSFTIPFQIVTSNLMIITQAFKKIKYKVLLRNLVENILKLVLTASLLFLGMGVLGAAAGLALSSAVIFVAALYVVNKKVYRIFDSKQRPEYNFSELAGYSWPLFAVGFFSIVMSTADTISLGILSTAYNTGIYSVAFPTAEILSLPSFALISLFLPVATGLYARKKMGELSKTYKTVVRWVFSATMPCMLFTVIFSADILSTIFGSVYAQGAAALAVLAIGIFAESVLGPVSSMLECIAKTKLVLLNTVIASVLNVLLNFALIPLFGIAGAAIATAMSFFCWNLLASLQVYFSIRLHPYNRAYLKPIMASFAVAGLFYCLRQAMPAIDSFHFPLNIGLLVFLGTAFLVVYALILLVIKGLQKEDIEILKAIENKTGVRVEFVRNIVKKFI